MKKIINKFKLYFLIFTIFIILIFFALKNQAFKSSIYNNIWKKLSEKNQFIVKLIFQKEFRENFEFRKYHNDYNEKFLPFTQFEKLNIKKKKLSFLSNIQKNTSYFQGKDKLSSFNIELVFKDKILIIDNNNNLFFLL